MSLKCKETEKAIGRLLEAKGGLRRTLLVVPDYTRLHSGAGAIAQTIYRVLEPGCRVDLLQALGTHAPMTAEQCAEMYENIPFERFIPHRWRDDVIRVGEVPGAFMRELSGGLMEEPVGVDVNRRLFDRYDFILSIGQVVPHEVAGMANHAKNIFVGIGGEEMIHASHMLGAFAGIEQVLGKTDTPVRRLFDYASRFIEKLPLTYILTVTDGSMFIGEGRACFEQAAARSQETDITFLDAPLQRVIVKLDAREYRSMWLGNKAIYRTRMAMADGGELIILAPGVERFGEDAVIDALIRKYGYRGREEIIRLFRENKDLRQNMSAAAHLIHGSGDGRFTITYCTRHLTEAEVTGVGFGYMPYDEAVEKYGNDREAYRIANPALGLWAAKERFTPPPE
ncbi:MAG: lactate racemase domain-containing protein [Oscillospiraceae bacterium]|nr:lactate racemase domain-containing protein [Oscillospiraceae bacterium]